jgi:4-hydroxybenzoate polyprenyltransferase
MLSLRTLLVLGRISNLPTVWSNCIAGWWLGGRGDWPAFVLLLCGATLLYLGGMFLNDAFDSKFDSIHRRARPIPSGAIAVKTVFNIGFVLLAVGTLSFCLIGRIPGLLGFALALCIVLYDAIHKIVTLSPVLMAGCRFLLYVIAGSCTAEGLSGWPVWCGLALAFYVVGLSFLARKESTGGQVNWWPCVLMAAPIALALFMDHGIYRTNAVLLSLLLAAWVANSVRFAFASANANVGRGVSGLLAGIVLVDVLALVGMPNYLWMIFAGLFVLAVYLQRYVPAT